MDWLWIFRWLANADVLGSTGLNIFSLLIFLLMAATAIKTSIYKSKLWILIDSVLLPMFFYRTLDFANYMTWMLISGDIATYFPFAMLFTVVLIPFAAYAYINRKHLNFKALMFTMPLSIAIIILSISFFGTWNMRALSGDTRTCFYICSFIPMWLLWLVGYSKFLKM